MITPGALRQCAFCVYLAADEGPAEDISRHLNEAADTIEQQSEQIATLELSLKSLQEHHEAQTKDWEGKSDAKTAEIAELEELVREAVNLGISGEGTCWFYGFCGGQGSEKIHYDNCFTEYPRSRRLWRNKMVTTKI